MRTNSSLALNQTLVDVRGNPIAIPMSALETPEVQAIKRSWNSFITALGGLDRGPDIKARDPFGNHVWVYASIMAIARNMAQVPFVVWEENPDDPATRRGAVVRRAPKAGLSRRAVQRFMNQGHRKMGFRIRGAEPLYDGDLADLFHSPNPVQSSMDFFQTTAMMLMLRGACFWVKTRKGGMPISPGETAQELWPMDANWFEPVRQRDRFIGWHAQIPYGVDASGTSLRSNQGFQPHEIAFFRLPYPGDPLGWMSPLTAAASGISMDMAAIAYNRAVLKNGAKPGGLLLHEDDVDEVEEAKLKKYWAARHEGPQNANRLAILTGNFKYVDIGLGPKDMEYLEQRRWDREEIMAALGVSQATLSISTGLNYATQLSQDKNFWDKTLMPLMLMMEAGIDKDVFGLEADNIFGAFDFSKVEALRQGLGDKINQVVQLTGAAIHMPPRNAFDIVGLPVSPYEGDDVCLIPATLRSTMKVIEAELAEANPTGDAGDSGQDQKPGEDQQPRPSVDEPSSTEDGKKK